MKKTIKIIFGLTITLLVLLVSLPIFFADCFYLDDTKQGRATNDIRVIGQAIKKLITEGTLTTEVWSKISNMKDLAPLIAPQLEQGNAGLLDPWGDPYILEKRREDGHIIIKISCNRRLKPRCLEWKEKVIGIEITLTEQKGEITQIKHLWMVD